MAKVLSMLCVATEEQQTLHKHLPDMITCVSGKRAEFQFVQPPHVEAGSHLYGISPHRIPSYVHPVPCQVVLKALRKIETPFAFLLDGSVHLTSDDVKRIVDAVVKLKEGEGLALPVRYNFCPDGPLTTFFRDGTPRFEFGILPKVDLMRGLEAGEMIYTGDVVLSELAIRQGIRLHVANCMIHRFPERIFLCRGLAARKENGLPFPKDVCLDKDYHRRFPGSRLDCTAVSIFRSAMQEGEIALMTETLNVAICANLHGALDKVRPDLIQKLQAQPIRHTLPNLMAAIEPYMDIFESRLDLLNCLVVLKCEELRQSIRLGDRDFWSAYSRYTMNDMVLMSKLLYLKV